MVKKLLIVVLALSASVAYAAPDTEHTKIDLVAPAGDPQAGRQAFVALGCGSCHAVQGDRELSRPVTSAPVPVLGPAHGKLSPGKIASAIVSPSHTVSKEVQAKTEGKLSPMADFSASMTVRQLVDVVAYVRSLDD